VLNKNPKGARKIISGGNDAKLENDEMVVDEGMFSAADGFLYVHGVAAAIFLPSRANPTILLIIY
jgi:hypothetical protein